VIDPSKPLFSFAVIGDTPIKPESGDQSAPWPVNDLATARAQWIVPCAAERNRKGA
jgi:hypothetical protein